MSKRTVFTTVTPLPAGITRESVLETLYSHVEMIDLNPLVEERHPVKPPAKAAPEEINCSWYSLTDKISYLPGGLVTGKVQYYACFHDLPNGLQTHCYAPMGLDIKGLWTLGGSLPGEPIEAQVLGIGMPKQGLWLREDVDMKCNIIMTSFVKKTLKKAHSTLVDRLVEKSHVKEAHAHNARLMQNRASSVHSTSSYGSPAPQYTAPYSDVNSTRTASPLSSPRIPYQTPGIPGQRQSTMPSPSYLAQDPAYQEAQQRSFQQYQDPRQSYLPNPQDPRLGYVHPGLAHDSQTTHPVNQEPKSFAAELPADDGALLYSQKPPSFTNDVAKSQPVQGLGLPAREQHRPISELPVELPSADAKARYQLQDLHPPPLNPKQSYHEEPNANTKPMTTT